MPAPPSAADWTIVRRKPVSREPSVPTAMTPLDLTMETDPAPSACAVRARVSAEPGPATRVPGGRVPAGGAPGPRGGASPSLGGAGGSTDRR